MSIISLTCERCQGTIVLDNSTGIATCEYCFAEYAVKEDKIVQEITQHVTKHIYGYQDKDVEDLLCEGFGLLSHGNTGQANSVFKRAIDVDSESWGAWYGYAITGGPNTSYLSMLPAYETAMSLADGMERRMKTFVGMTSLLPNSNIRSAFIRAFNLADARGKKELFYAVSKVVGCDESEIARLAIDKCPNDWRPVFAMAQERKVRARWAKKRLFGGIPEETKKVRDLFVEAYRFAKKDGQNAANEVRTYIDDLGRDPSYSVLVAEIRSCLA